MRIWIWIDSWTNLVFPIYSDDTWKPHTWRRHAPLGADDVYLDGVFSEEKVRWKVSITLITSVCFLSDLVRKPEINMMEPLFMVICLVGIMETYQRETMKTSCRRWLWYQFYNEHINAILRPPSWILFNRPLWINVLSRLYSKNIYIYIIVPLCVFVFFFFLNLTDIPISVYPSHCAANTFFLS